MKLLAALATASGLAWLVGFVTLSSGWEHPAWGLIGVVLGYLAAAAVALATAGAPGRLPARLAILWLVAVGIAYVTLSPVGDGLLLVGVAFLYGTLAFLLWLSVPLVIHSFFAWRPSAG